MPLASSLANRAADFMGFESWGFGSDRGVFYSIQGVFRSIGAFWVGSGRFFLKSGRLGSIKARFKFGPLINGFFIGFTPKSRPTGGQKNKGPDQL